MKRPLLFVSLWVVVFFLILLKSGWADKLYVRSLAVESGTSISFTAQVSYKDSSYIYLDHLIISDVQQKIPASLRLLAALPEDESAYPIGATVECSATFRASSSATNPGEFDFLTYYQSLKILGSLKNAELERVGTFYAPMKEWLYRVRLYFTNRLYEVFPEKEASVMTAMLLGDKSGLDADVKALYQENGIFHILSISGLHISLIGLGVYKLLRKLGAPVFVCALAGALLLCLYGIMTGLSVSALRAIGMYLLQMLACVCRRTYDLLTAAGLLLAFMVIQNPWRLYHAGFLLSFGAVFGIGLLLPALEEVPALLRPGLSITLFTLPLQLWWYYEVATYSVLLNVLVVPAMGLVMGAGLIAMLIPGLGIVGTVDVLLLQYYEILCTWFQKLPLHTWNPGKPKLWQVVIYYLLLGLFLCWKAWIKEKRKEDEKYGKGRLSLAFARIAVLGWVILCVFVMAIPKKKYNAVTFLDVGQGNGIVLTTDAGATYLFDAGSSSKSSLATYILLPYLKSQGIHSLDAIIVSHPDADHISGILELLACAPEENIAIGSLVLSDIATENRSAAYADLYEAWAAYLCSVGRMEEGKAEGSAAETAADVTADFDNLADVLYLAAGDTWESNQVRFLCLHPNAGWSGTDANAYSACIYVTFPSFSLLLTGDVEEAGEEALLAELQAKNLQVDVLQVAHHGSKYTTSAELLTQLQPLVGIISVGTNTYGHPHADTLARLEEAGAAIYTTLDYGAVILQEKGGQVVLKTFLE